MNFLKFMLWNIQVISYIWNHIQRSHMMTSMETLFALLALCEGNPPVTGGFPHKRGHECGILICLWWQPEQTVWQTIALLVIWDAVTVTWRHCYDNHVVSNQSVSIRGCQYNGMSVISIVYMHILVTILFTWRNVIRTDSQNFCFQSWF